MALSNLFLPTPHRVFWSSKVKNATPQSNIKLFLKCRDLLHQAIHPVLLYSTNVSTGDIYLHIYTTHQRARHIFAPVFMVTYGLEPLLHSNCSNTQKDGSKKEYIVRKKMYRKLRRKARQAWAERERLNKEKRCKGKYEKEMLRFPLRGRGKKLLQWCSRRRGNSTFHPTPDTAVSANISLLVLAGSSQAVRQRSGKLRRDRLTARHSLSLIV